MYLERAKQRYAEMMEEFKDLNLPYQTLPAYPENIEQLERQLGFPLPAAYKEFLLWMGGGADRFMDHLDFGVGDVPYNQEDAPELMEDYCREPLPDDAIVFAMAGQGYYFFFIRVSEGEDPPIHSYRDTKEKFDLNVFPSLDTMIFKAVEGSIHYHREEGRGCVGIIWGTSKN
ncbi:SMI1/KNR4 family protein [Baaleninema simplex]|uniref:SMI1/KNR4 family protein n=1 Tax=Baaleninema simplex TaxID=2862350 RepID=UPI0003489973|nr:SMI1/KNR4 family protein [Baaleninema simplex]